MTVESKRYPYLDFLRVLACFLVIVNHTNSYVFLQANPLGLTWLLSITWYYFSKTAVPLFIMVSGACLLPKRDGYRRTASRVLRMLGALLLFSYVYYLLGLWKSGWNLPAALDIAGFLRSIWRERITDSFWYLYFYIGLLLMTPLLQRMARGMEKKDYGYLLALSFGFNGLWPLLTHYAPSLALPQYFDLPLFGVFIGLFFAGHYLHALARPRGCHKRMCVLLILLCLVAATGLTALETLRVQPGEKYWFMDERTAPALPIVLCAVAMMALARMAFTHQEGKVPGGGTGRSPRVWAALGSCAFTVYLWQDLVTAETRYLVFVPLSGFMNPFLAGLIWSIGVFLVSLSVAWGCKRIPGVQKIL